MNEKLKNGKETELGDGEKGLWRGSGMVEEKWCESGRGGRVRGRNKTDQPAAANYICWHELDNGVSRHMGKEKNPSFLLPMS